MKGFMGPGDIVGCLRQVKMIKDNLPLRHAHGRGAVRRLSRGEGGAHQPGLTASETDG